MKMWKSEKHRSWCMQVEGFRSHVACIKPKARDADLWRNIWEELHGLVERGILVELEHVKALRTKEEMKHMS